MRASVASLSKKFVSTFFAATLAVSLVPAAAFAVDSDAADVTDSEAVETNSDTPTEAAVSRPEIISTVVALESNENEVSGSSTSSAVQDESMDDALVSADEEKENGEDVVADDEPNSSIIAGGIINQTQPLEVVAEQESTRSYFLAQTLESTRTIPVVSAQLPIDTGGAEQPVEGHPSNGEEANETSGTGTVVSTIAADSIVVGSFEYLGMTFAIEADGASVALMAVDYSKLPEAFVEKQVIVIPESVTPDGIDYYSVTHIADDAFASLKKDNADPDCVGCEALFSGEGLLDEADVADLGVDNPLAGCTGILALGIPATVAKIEDDAISGFETLQYIVVSDDNSEYASFDGALYSADKSQLRLIPEGRVGAVCVASSVTEVDPEVFSHCPLVETLVTDADGADNQLPRGDVSAITRAIEMTIFNEALIESSSNVELLLNAESAPLALETAASYAATAYTVTFTGSGTVEYTRRFNDGKTADQVISTQTLNNQTWSKASTNLYSSVSNASVFINDSSATSTYYHFYRIKPTNPGFSCTGWTFAGSTMANHSSTSPTKAGALAPVWKANTITMTWNCNGGNTVNNNASVTSFTTTQTYAASAKVTMPTIPYPARSLYTFKGWYTTASNGTQVTASTALPTSNTTYYAQWNAVTLYNVTFKWSGSATSAWTKRYLKEDGWSSAGKDSVTSSETLNDASKLYKARAVYSSGTNVSVFSGQYGRDTGGMYEYFWRIKPARPGYTCSGWTLGGTSFSGSIPSMKSGDLVPTWSANTITMTWDSNGGSTVANTSKVYADNAKVVMPTATEWLGRTFDGWFTEASGGTQVTANTPLPTSNITYYAHWTENVYYIAVKPETGASLKSDADLVVKASALKPTLPDVTISSGYAWGNWSMPATTGLTLNDYTKPSGASVTAVIQKDWKKDTVVGTVTAKTTQTLWDVTFKWAGSATCTWTKRYTGAPDVEVSTETLTNANKEFHCRYVYSSGTNVSIFSSQTGTDEGGSYEYFWRVTPSKLGSTCSGWTLNGVAFAGGIGDKMAAGILEPTWTANSYGIAYVVVDGSGAQKAFDEAGWFTDEGYTVPAMDELPRTYNEANAGSKLLPPLYKRGYTWGYWTVKESTAHIDRIPSDSSGAITVVAHFTANPYTVKVHLADATESTGWEASYTRTYDDPVLELPATAPKRAGYKFGGFEAYASEDEGASSVSVIDVATGGSADTLLPGGSYKVLDLKTGAGAPYDVAILRPVWTERIAVDVPTDISFGVLADFSDQKLHFQYGKSSYDPTAAKDTYAPLTFTSYTTAPLGIVAIEAESDATEIAKVFGDKANEVSVTLSGDGAGSIAHKVGLNATLTPSSGTDRLAGLDLAAATTAGMPTTIRFGLDFGDIAFDEIAFNESATIARLHYTVAILKDGATTAASSVLGPVDEDGEKVVW